MKHFTFPETISNPEFEKMLQQGCNILCGRDINAVCECRLGENENKEQIELQHCQLGRGSCKKLSSLRDEFALILMCFFAGYDPKQQKGTPETITDDQEPLPSVNHVLLEGINGMAKTTLVSIVTNILLGEELLAFYELTDWDRYVRVSGSPDQTPSDLLGFDTPDFNEATEGRRLVFSPGPILQDKLIWYCDELNRCPPKTQSVWLEPMAERGRVTISTIDKEQQHQRTRRLNNFFLIASQNPSNHEGTFPLPEAMLDRFMVKITMNYTDKLYSLVRDGEPRFNGLSKESLEKIWTGDKMKSALKNVEDKGIQEAVDKFINDKSTKDKILEQHGEMLLLLEGELLKRRREELAKIKWEVRKVRMGKEELRGIAELIAHCTEFTWTDDAYKKCFGGMKIPFGLNRARQKTVGLLNDDGGSIVEQGASPRAAIAQRDLVAAYAWAVGRQDVREPTKSEDSKPESEHDVYDVMIPVLRHRIILNHRAKSKGISPEIILQGYINSVTDSKTFLKDDELKHKKMEEPNEEGMSSETREEASPPESTFLSKLVNILNMLVNR